MSQKRCVTKDQQSCPGGREHWRRKTKHASLPRCPNRKRGKKKSGQGRWGRRHQWKSGLGRWGRRHQFLLHVPCAALANVKPTTRIAAWPEKPAKLGRTSNSRVRESSQEGAPLVLSLRCLAALWRLSAIQSELQKSEDAAGHAGLRAVKQWRILLLLLQTRASSLRLVCVVSVVCKSIPQPHITRPCLPPSPLSSLSTSPHRFARSRQPPPQPKSAPITLSYRILQNKFRILFV